MEPNMRLVASMEAVFDSSQARVVIAFEVLKEKEGTRYWNKASGKKARSPRVLCLTVKRSKNRGYNGTLFICKATPSQRPYYQIRSSWDMAKIYSIDVPKSTNSLPFFVELNVEKESRNYIFHSEDQRMCFVSTLMEICTIHENSKPIISGISADAITQWWQENSPTVLSRLGDFAQELLSTGTPLMDSEEDKPTSSSSKAFASGKEERDLNALLELFVMGPGDVQDFQTRLQDEHTALEDANVHAMLENGRAIDSLMSKLKSASHVLDDLDQNLLVFDMKLRHMKDDIAAIEARNNTLEMETRNNTKLLNTLQDLSSRLELGKESEQILEKSKFEAERLESIIQAAKDLHEILVQMNPDQEGGIPSSLRKMRAVKDQKLKLELLGKNFTSRANDYLILNFRQKSDQVLKSMVSASSPSRAPKLENNGSEIHEWTQQHGPLVKAMYHLQKDALASLGQIYCSTMNSIIRRRVHTFSNRLKISAKGTMAQSALDVEIAKRPTTETLFSPIEFMVSKARESVSGSHVSMSERSIPHSKGRNSSAQDNESQTPSTTAKVFGGDVELNSQLHEAFQQMLASVIPMLLEEANSAASFLVLWENCGATNEEKRLSDEGAQLIQMLVSGIEGDFFVLVDLTARGAYLMCLPMLATTYKWIRKISSNPISWILLGHLKSIQERLKKTFDDFMQKQVAEIHKYDTKRSVKANGVKAFHVLPFVSNFPLLVHRIESLLAEVEEEEESYLASCSSVLPRQTSVESTDSSKLLQKQTSLESSKSYDVSMSVTEPVRKEVDLAYRRIVENMFKSIENMATSDTKHGDRLKLENYSYFDTSVVPLSAHVPVLTKYCQDVTPLMKESMRKYVQQQLEYGRLWSILDFSNKIEKKLEEVNPQEVAFQNGYSSQEVRTLITQTMASTDKKLSLMYTRVKKHLGDTAPKLLATVWQNVEKEVLDRYRKLEKQMLECYPNIPLSPSPEELEELFKTTGPGS